MNTCKLCDGNFDFRRMQITEILGEVRIQLSPNLNLILDKDKFKYCPLCGKKLEDKNFKGGIYHDENNECSNP